MGLFKKKEKPEKQAVCDVRANNLFGKMLLDGENIEVSIDGKCEAENLVFSVAVLSLTNKRCFYYKQDGSQTATERIDGRAGVIRCLKNSENQSKINTIIFQLQSRS